MAWYNSLILPTSEIIHRLRLQVYAKLHPKRLTFPEVAGWKEFEKHLVRLADVSTAKTQIYKAHSHC